MLERCLVSQRVKVRWAGWETDTFQLQQAGWELCVQQNPMSDSMRMVCRHQGYGFVGQTNDIPCHLAMYGHSADGPMYGYPTRPVEVWQMTQLARAIQVVSDAGPITGYMGFKAIDARPQLQMREIKDLEDLVPFAGAPIVQSRALILPEASVDDLLAGILERQQEAKMAFFEDLVQREGDVVRPPAKFHAQIISLDDYRRAA